MVEFELRSDVPERILESFFRSLDKLTGVYYQDVTSDQPSPRESYANSEDTFFDDGTRARRSGGRSRGADISSEGSSRGGRLKPNILREELVNRHS
jgi:hypothetical protein